MTKLILQNFFKQFLSTIVLSICLNPIYAQQKINTLNTQNIEIIRDNYGIPHIFTKTDAEAVYGVAWAQCEDNFDMMQENFAATKGMAGRIMGTKGAALDFIFQAFQINDFVEERYQKDISPKMESMLAAYAEAVNQYAKTHPDEVKSKKLLPITPKQITAGYALQMLLMHNSILELGKLLTKDYDYALKEKAGKGSNAMAYSPNFTSDEKTYLIGNPHQPVNKMGNFWEVSVHSEEGYEMFGVTFSVGGILPVIGNNRNLGWSHTTNYQNSADVYELEMHPTQKNKYQYDGEWLTLEEKKAKLKVKIGPVVIPASKKYYLSKYGPTFKKKSGYYSYKSNGLSNLKAAEQWYKMGLSKNMDEFMEALDMQGLAAQTITYADKEGNIYHLSNFIHPYRNEEFDWTTILKGNTSANNWNWDAVHPVSDLPQIKNPNCGYLYNCNNTVFKMTAPEENLVPKDFPASFHLLSSNTIRAKTFERLIANYDEISLSEARKIRENVTIDKTDMAFRNCMNCDIIPEVLAKHPKLAKAKVVFDKWNGSFSVDNKQAALVTLTSLFMKAYIQEEMGNIEKEVPEEEIVKAIKKAKKFLKRHYGTLEVELGEIQKAVRHDVEMPMYGGVNTLASTHVKKHKKGKLKITDGDSYIFYAKYGEGGLESLETINAFGNSLTEGHPHSTDQTEIYVNMQTKIVELDLEKIRRLGEAYHPE